MNNQELEKKVKRIINEVANKKGYVAPLDVLLELGYLSKQDHESWRFGKVEYLEKVCGVNLKKLSLINRIIRVQSSKMKFVPSHTIYKSWGKGPKRTLRFSKSGDRNIEKNYSIHHLNKYVIDKINS